MSISRVFRINGTPLQIAPLGIMNVDYRIFVRTRSNINTISRTHKTHLQILTREGQILTIKNGEISGRVLPCDGVPVGMVCAGAKEIYIALSNRVFEVRTMKGRKVCSVHLESNILDMQLFEKDKSSRAVILGLANGEIRIYKLNRLLYKSNRLEEDGVAQDNIMALRCGRYGRSNTCLTSVRRSGTSLSIYILIDVKHVRARTQVHSGSRFSDVKPSSILRVSRLQRHLNVRIAVRML